MSDAWMDGSLAVPRLTMSKLLTRHAKLVRMRAVGAPSVLIKRQEDLLAQALEELQLVNAERGWFPIEEELTRLVRDGRRE